MFFVVASIQVDLYNLDRRLSERPPARRDTQLSLLILSMNRSLFTETVYLYCFIERSNALYYFITLSLQCSSGEQKKYCLLV